MSGDAAEDRWADRGVVLLWLAMFAGPAAWAFNQGVGYAVMKAVCASGNPYVLWTMAIVSLALAVAGGWIGWWWLAQFRSNAVDDGGTGADRSYFMAVLAIALNVLIGVLIVTSLIPQFLLSPCE